MDHHAARITIERFVADHPSYCLAPDLIPSQGSTNSVHFLRHNGNQVVAKVFCEPERKERECFGLRHWAGSGLVPELIWDQDPLLIIMSFIPGCHLHLSRDRDGQAGYLRHCEATGAAVGSVSVFPLSSAARNDFERRFYQPLGSLRSYLERILSLGRSIQAIDPCFQDPFWKDSLDLIAQELPRMVAETAILYHQDTGNLHVQHGRFMGFYDLEMCRVGGTSMQLASALRLLDTPDGWHAFRTGWEHATGGVLSRSLLISAEAGVHALGWREISRYLSYDGTPGSGFSWASAADPEAYRHLFTLTRALLQH